MSQKVQYISPEFERFGLYSKYIGQPRPTGTDGPTDRVADHRTTELRAPKQHPVGDPDISPLDIFPARTIPPPFLHGVPPPRHHHALIYIKRSTVNVYKIDSG